MRLSRDGERRASPHFVVFLARSGLVTWKQLLQFSQYAVLVIFIVAAVLTPTPDAASQFMMAVPLMVLYALSIGVAWAFGRERKSVDDVEDPAAKVAP